MVSQRQQELRRILAEAFKVRPYCVVIGVGLENGGTFLKSRQTFFYRIILPYQFCDMPLVLLTAFREPVNLLLHCSSLRFQCGTLLDRETLDGGFMGCKLRFTRSQRFLSHLCNRH